MPTFFRRCRLFRRGRACKPPTFFALGRVSSLAPAPWSVRGQRAVAALRSDAGATASWPGRVLIEVRIRKSGRSAFGQSGRHLLTSRLTGFDPKATLPTDHSTQSHGSPGREPAMLADKKWKASTLAVHVRSSATRASSRRIAGTRVCRRHPLQRCALSAVATNRWRTRRTSAP